MRNRPTLRIVRTSALAIALGFMGAACDWSMPGFDATRAGVNPAEHTINAGNVSTLEEAFVAPGVQAPIVTNGNLIGTVGYGIRAFDASGASGCTGAPRVCAPRWYASPGFETGGPAAGGGTVFVGAGRTLYAYDVTTNGACSAVHASLCSPTWISAIAGSPSGSPAVAGGSVYVATQEGIVSAHAVSPTNCSDAGPPRVCGWRWAASLGFANDGQPFRPTEPAVGNGRVFVASAQGRVFAIPVNSANGPSQQVEWTADVDPSLAGDAFQPRPTVVGNRLYVGFGSTVFVFDANGATGCTGVAGQGRTCVPLFTLDAQNVTGLAVANGQVFVGGYTDDAGVRVFDANGVNGCSGSPKACEPLRTYPTQSSGGASGAPVIANGVLYVMTFSFDQFEVSVRPRLLAFDAAGVQGCSGVPKECAPLYDQLVNTGPTGIGDAAAPMVVDGTVYALGGDEIHAYRLP